jgi:hypothetical protein
VGSDGALQPTAAARTVVEANPSVKRSARRLMASRLSAELVD